MTRAKLTEIDVFFELFLPMLLTKKQAALARFSAVVQLELKSGTRAWVVKGGPTPPWITRGVAQAPALTLVFDDAVVAALVQGRAAPVALDALVDARGDPRVLETLGLQLDEARGVLDTLLAR